MFLDKISLYQSYCSSIISFEWCSIWSTLIFTISIGCLLADSRVRFDIWFYFKRWLFCSSMEFRPKSFSDAASRFRTNSISSVLSMVGNNNWFVFLLIISSCIQDSVTSQSMISSSFPIMSPFQVQTIDHFYWK